jgi:hypothetical protein
MCQAAACVEGEGGLRASEEIVAVLGPAIEEAAVAAVRDAEVERPFVVEVRLLDGRYPPFVRVGGDRLRSRMTELSHERRGAMRRLYQARPPEGARVELRDYLSADALVACGEMNWALSYERGRDHPDRRRAGEIGKRLGGELTARLNQRDWHDAAQPFLALVETAPYYEVDPLALARAVVGDDRIAAFEESIAPRAPSRDLPQPARTDRAALEAELGARGLGDVAARIVAEAQLAFHLRPADRDVATRLGGSALLPPGDDWPHAQGDRPLTFLAGIDLSELPLRTGLPEAGWFLFFADLDNDEALGLIEPAENEEGSPARMFYVPPGTEPVVVKPPHKLRDELVERPVTPAPQLTLPDDYELGERLDLDVAAASVVEEIANELRYAGRDGFGDDHWILGAVTGAQGHPTEPGTVLLLHMGWDEPLGFEFLDAGAIQFRIPEPALAAGDWDAVTIEPDSG